ncbi:MAG: serine/threonine-protein kinase [Kofleriaceae bacterium]
MERFGAGTRIGNYRVEADLAANPTGDVYQVVHVLLARRALLKIRAPEQAVALLREACLLEALVHPGVPRIYESGVLNDRRPWFAVEALQGPTLADKLIEGPLPMASVARLLRELSEVLEHAHRRGVIHRALAPEQIVLTNRAFSACIIDWSEARTHDAIDVVHRPARSYPYLPPELARGELADDRADVFSLGVIAYQALTGTLPFVAPGVATTTPHVSTSERCQEAPIALAELVDQMLALERFDRPTASEIRSSLDVLTIDAFEPSGGVPVHVPSLADIDTQPVAFPRFRQPRWTPHASYVASDRAKEVSGEIVVPGKTQVPEA